MPSYEYVRLPFDWGDLTQLNALGADGWRVVHVAEGANVLDKERPNYALMGREMVGAPPDRSPLSDPNRNPAVPIITPIIDESFTEWEKSARSVGMQGSEGPDGDWHRARTLWWPRLGLERQFQLVNLFQQRIAAGDYDDSRYVPGVVSFFASKWDLPVRGNPDATPRKAKQDAERDAVLAQLRERKKKA